jgi:hypothetical protein
MERDEDNDHLQLCNVDDVWGEAWHLAREWQKLHPEDDRRPHELIGEGALDDWEVE